MEQKQFNTKEIQTNLLEILLYFNDFCRQNNLKYTLAGGTLLGAVRHKGFIPWDDDLDIFMLREDYEKLYTIWNKHADINRYSIVRSNEKLNIHHSATEIQDNNTTFVLSRNLDLDSHQGLMIDVIPLDNVAPTIFGKISQMINSMIYCCFNFQRMPEHKGGLTTLATKIALTIVPSFKLRYLIWNYADRQIRKYSDKSGLVASFGEGATIMRQRFPRDWFLDPLFLEFEGHILPVPADYDKWLSVSYGDYMQLPSIDEQIPRHEALFIDLDTPFVNYKGKYFGENRTEFKD